MGPVDVTDPRTQHDRTQDEWAPGEGWAPDEDREEYVDLAALERAHAQQVVVDALDAPTWPAPTRAGGRDDGTDDGDADEGGTNSEGDDYDPDEDPDADPDTIDPQRQNRPETD